MKNLLIILLICFAVFAQSDFESLLDKVKQHYYDGEYKEAIEVLEKASSELAKLENQKKLELYMYLAFSYMAFDNEESAREQFRNILDIDPDFSLDPEMVPPKIINLFEDVKKQYNSTSKPEAAVTTQHRPSEPQPEVDTGAMTKGDVIWRSAVLPGLGQTTRGDKGIGIGLMGAWGVAIGFTVFSHVQYASDKDAYEEAMTPHNAQRLYDDYNTSYKMKNMSYGVLAGVWAVSMVEAMITKPDTRLGLIVDPLESRLALEVKF